MWPSVIHYANHFVVILLIACLYQPRQVWKAYLVLLASMIVDVDHLWAVPIFDPDRCSIGFHTFHSELAICLYVLGVIFIKHKWFRLFCIGLVFHMITDGIDCWWSGL